jgi:hypothetical protein
MAKVDSEFDGLLDRLDLEAIEDPSNKIAECEYFLSLASAEQDRQRFRWLISAFFGAAYSFFEMSALHAYLAFTAPDTGESIEDGEALEILKTYVNVERKEKRKEKRRQPYVTTYGKHEICKKLYELRQRNVHHYPLAIMSTGPQLPEDFHFGSMRGQGTPALAFCREALVLIHQVQRELSA